MLDQAGVDPTAAHDESPEALNMISSARQIGGRQIDDGGASRC